LPPPGSLGLPKASGERSSLPFPRREVAFKAGTFRSVLRLCAWLVAGILFILCVLWDWVHGRNTIKRRAIHLRETFERMGTTFVKIGQQLSMRLDLLPFVYTRELEKMLDNVPPFPVEVAIRTIERAAGRPLNEIFSAFDPEPVGSASVACVYQAILKTGQRVAVKVRRPEIAMRLAADMRALHWIALATEQLLFAPGFTANFVFELRTMLMEELDFVREARFSDLYRRRVRKTRQMRFVSAPKIFFDYSSEEVMVSEFVSGIWMKDLLPALENGDRQTQSLLKELNIDPVILARRIQIIARFNNFENIFFHADLHPGNILVKPDNKIVLIDFGSCGSFNNKELNSWRRWFDAQSIDDVGGMVQAALAILEPLPPIDKDHFALRLEYLFWNDLYAIKSKHSHWSERISSRLWMGFLNLSREFQVPLRLNTLRMIRASMLTDTIAARLDNKQDPYREFRRYERMAGWRAKTRLKKRIHHLLGPGKFIRMEQGLDSTLKFAYQLQRMVDSVASIRIGSIIGRTEYFITLMLRAAAWACASLGVMTVFFFTAHALHFQGLLKFFGMEEDASTTIFITARHVLRSNLWLMLVVAPLLFIFWRVSFRLEERRPWDR
jgi:predicted unusual protein kinase regulating ubiquinone biosynthesis (AarF/ABC1/UbiB family)